MDEEEPRTQPRATASPTRPPPAPSSTLDSRKNQPANPKPARQRIARRCKWMGWIQRRVLYGHGLVGEVGAMVSQEVLGEKHAGGPQAAAASFLQVLAEEKRFV
jgi:hypothetical protein